MEYYRNKIRNESYRIKTDERYELQKKNNNNKLRKRNGLFYWVIIRQNT